MRPFIQHLALSRAHPARRCSQLLLRLGAGSHIYRLRTATTVGYSGALGVPSYSGPGAV
jgi:hypothetical protein